MKYPVYIILLAALVFSGCDKNDPDVPSEPEVITTFNYTLTPLDGGTPVVFSFVDWDGDGGNLPTITGGTLAANQTYAGSSHLLNESINPAINITEEIEEHDEEHQFFFQTNVSNLNITYNDQDENDNPVGLSSTLTTGDAASGTITVILRHEPDKSASGVSNGNITNAGGETDIEVTFSVNVE